MVQIASGFHHNLAVKSDGTPVAWGQDSFGTATIPAGLTSVLQKAGGEAHSVALRPDHTVYAWGDNNYRQIGVPTGVNSVSQVAAGKFFTVCLPQMALAVGPYNTQGGDFQIVTIYLSAPAEGTIVGLVSSNPVATVPVNVLVASGQTSATFQVKTTC